MIFGKLIKWILFIALIGIVVMAIRSSMDKVNSQIKTAEEFENTKISISLFYATWCGHCESFLKSGKFDTLASEINDVNFFKYDVDKNKEKANKYNIEALPTILALDSNGKVLGEFQGDRSDLNDLKSFVTSMKMKNS